MFVYNKRTICIGFNFITINFLTYFNILLPTVYVGANFLTFRCLQMHIVRQTSLGSIIWNG